MFTQIDLLRNIGRFRSVNPGKHHPLSKLSLLYADNAQGKTTLTAVLRSLASGDPLPIIERHRLGSQHPAHAVLSWQNEPTDKSTKMIFENDAWNFNLTDLKVFNDNFIDENVYSGLDVDARHRQNLHELILGDQGVALNRKLQALVNRVEEHNTAKTEKANAIPESLRFGLSVDEYCALTNQSKLDNKISTVERNLQAAQDHASVHNEPLLASIELPNFEREEIENALLTGLSDLDDSAETQVQAHIQTLGEGGEPWVADGMNRVAHQDEYRCPFCGQDIEAIDLILHYRAYFSQEYTYLKKTVTRLLNDINRNHASRKQLEFERSVSTLAQALRFWSSYCNVPTINVDTNAIINDWNTAREMVAQQLAAKQSAPLEPQALNQSTIDALNTYVAHMQDIEKINETLLHANKEIKRVKQKAGTADTRQIIDTLNRLKATKSRFQENIVLLCDDYMEELKAKDITEKARDEVRAELEEYRNNVFPELQSGVNAYLKRFNAGFCVGNLTPSNIGRGSGSSCTYNVIINDEPIAVKGNRNPPGKPSFRNSLSAGDRNTLALALFFSSLDRNPNLDKTVAVIDDPMASLDDHRSLATVQTVRDLARRTKQTIVLSHNKRFLCGILDGMIGNEDYATLEIAPNGNESTIRSWDASRDAITEHDQQYRLLQGYVDDQSGNEKEVARAIRFYLEGYYRVACPGQFPPGRKFGIGKFIEKCRKHSGQTDEVIDSATIVELDNVLEYANRFHHDTNPAWQAERISPAELVGFVERALSLARP